MFLEVKNVTKSIHGDIVIKNVSLCSERGRVIGLRGINGSGKTMLMRLISGLIRPTKGQILIDGEVVSKDIPFPRSLGVLIEGPAFLDDYSAMDNLKLIAYPKGKVTEDEIKAVLSEVRLDPKSRKKYKKFSLGMKQRLGIAAAVMEHPDLILLDEPTNALDESGVDMLGDIVKKEKDRGAVLIVSSHDRDILEDISDEIYDLDQGEIVRHSIKGRSEVKAKKILLCAVSLVLLLLIVVRIVHVNTNVLTIPEERYAQNQWVELNGAFQEMDDENTEGYSVRILGAEQLTYNEFLEKYGASENPPEGKDDIETVLDVEYEFRNVGNSDGYLLLIQYMIAGPYYSLIFDSTLWSVCTPTGEGQLATALQEDTTYSFHVPYIFAGGFSKDLEGEKLAAVVSRIPVKKMIEFTL